MPTVSITQLPKSRSSEEFENMCADVLNKMFGVSFSRYGRQGQNQNGIDLVSASEPHIGVQCKNYYMCDYNKLRSQVQKDIESIKNLPFDIKTFIIMTSLDFDNKTQDLILSQNTEFNILIFFWEVIQTEICNDEVLLQKYYPIFFNNCSISIEIKNELISNTKTLIEGVEILSNSERKCQYDYNVSIYNICILILNSTIRLSQLYDAYYLQLKKGEIGIFIENIKKSIPEFYDETLDGTGGAMICTIGNFWDYFKQPENKNEFINYCEKIIEFVEKL